MQPPTTKFPVPPEILLLISTHLDRFLHLNSLVRASRFTYHLLNRHLYTKALTTLSRHTPVYTPPTLPTTSTRRLTHIYNGFRSIAGWAILHGPLGALENLLRYGLAIDARFADWGWGGVRGATLLMVAVLHQREEVVRMLLQKGASCEVVDDVGCRAGGYVIESLVAGMRVRGRRAFAVEKQVRGVEEMVVVLEGEQRVFVLQGRLYRIAAMLHEHYQQARRKRKRVRFI
ncbi:hypothetical protein BDD12DRAFT_867814 [Trichophaea hybrida]|nr:hypothetical protein BDD12DRAFT_867814 [Trichophaea hybrida]